MKTYIQIVNGIRYQYFYDRNIRSWTVYKVDKNDYQIGDADYYANRSGMLIHYPKFDFKQVTSK